MPKTKPSLPMKLQEKADRFKRRHWWQALTAIFQKWVTTEPYTEHRDSPSREEWLKNKF